MITIGEWQIEEISDKAIRLTAPFGTYSDVFGIGTDPSDARHVMYCFLRMLQIVIPKLAPSTSNFTHLRERVQELEAERRVLLLQLAQTAQEGLALASAALRGTPKESES